jgi:ribosomal protein L40E
MRHAAAKSLVDVQSSRRTCAQCGLVNFGEAETCRRCRTDLAETTAIVADVEASASHTRGARRTLLIVAATIGLSIFAWSRSLLLTSTPIDASQRLMVMHSIETLERAGFTKEVIMLRHFANYRATDNWWNSYLGHQQAYAATNFPLGVVTLYAPFFHVATDDTERAAILLHEAQHLLGAAEPAALELTWREKSRLGWTAEKYGETKVWKNTNEWTITEVPSLFQCGADGHGDCVP